MTHENLFADIPVSGTVLRRWAENPAEVLDSAAQKITVHGANPWVFAADWRQFEQFAGPAEKAALEAMTPDERVALLGED